MSASSVNIQGFIDSLGEMKARALDAAERALNQFGEHVLGDAQQLCPVATGFLKASATSRPAEVGADGKLTKEIGFNANYAAIVHERLDVNHPNGEAKFLEKAVRNNAPKLDQFLMDEVRKVL